MLGQRPFGQCAEPTRSLVLFGLDVPLDFSPLIQPGADVSDLVVRYCSNRSSNCLDVIHNNFRVVVSSDQSATGFILSLKHFPPTIRFYLGTNPILIPHCQVCVFPHNRNQESFQCRS